MTTHADPAVSTRGFDRFAKRAHPHLAQRYGEAFADAVLADAREELVRLSPRLPDIGGHRNIFTPVITVNGWIISLFRAMERRGKTADDTVRVCAEVSDEFFRSWPGFLLRLVGRLAFTPLVKTVLKRAAARSQERRYGEDFVYVVREGADGELALEFSECAVNKLYDAEGVQALKPYCNFFDVTYSRLMGMGVDASETIGLGCDTCKLRYKHGRETAVPKKLQGVLPRT